MTQSQNMNRGWVRLWRNGPGLSWRPAIEGYVFSERYGYARAFRLGPWIVRLLRREIPTVAPVTPSQPVPATNGTAPGLPHSGETKGPEIAPEAV